MKRKSLSSGFTQAPSNGAYGFTLIELLVVISIIGLITSVILISLYEARVKARVSLANSDIKTVDQAFRIYSADNGDYPHTGWVDNPSSGDFEEICDSTTSCSSEPVFASLISKGYVNQMPYPPQGLDTSNGGYWYVHRIPDTTNPAVTKYVNCDLIGSTCGFKAPYTYSSCSAASGILPASATATAMLQFWFENGVSKDYVPNYFTNAPMGGNAICYY